jgi:predicted ArsR family transcriptional regulator
MSICLNLDSTAIASAEVDLHRAVVRQAIQDALGEGMLSPADQFSAYHLLTSPDLPWCEDRETLCALALVDEAKLVAWARETLPPQPDPPPLDCDAITLLELFEDQHTIPFSRLADEFDMPRKAVRAAVVLCQKNGWQVWIDSKNIYRWDVPESTDVRAAQALSPRTAEEKMRDLLKVLDRPMTARGAAFAADLRPDRAREVLDALVEGGYATARTMPTKYRVTDAGRAAVGVKCGWQGKLLAAMIDHGEPMSADKIREIIGHRALKPLLRDKLIALAGSAGDAKARWYSRTGKQLPPQPEPGRKPKVAREQKPTRDDAVLHSLAAVNRDLDRLDTADVIAALREHGPSTLDQITECVPISRGLVYRSLRTLERQGKAQRMTPKPRVCATDAGRAALAAGKVRRSTKTYEGLVSLVDAAGKDGILVERLTDEPVATLRRLGYAEAVGPQTTKRAEVWSLVDADELKIAA